MTAHDWARDPGPRAETRWRCRRCAGTVTVGGLGVVPDPRCHAYVRLCDAGVWELDCDDAAVRSVLGS